MLADFGVSARFSVDATRALHGEGELDKGMYGGYMEFVKP